MANQRGELSHPLLRLVFRELPRPRSRIKADTAQFMERRAISAKLPSRNG